jgi:hypothetical protein
LTVTVIVAGAVTERLPLVPVTVTVYVPALVPAVASFGQISTTFAAHPLIIHNPNPISNIRGVPRSSLRRRAGTRSSNNPASATPSITPFRFVAEVARHVLVGPAEVSEIVAVPVPPAMRLRLPGATAQLGGCAVTGDTEQLSATVPTNPLSDVPVSTHVLVVVVFATGVTDTVDGLDTRVKLPVIPVPPPPPPDAAAMKFATSRDPNPVAWSYPTPTTYPGKPPVRLDSPGVLLSHIDGVAAMQPVTPDVATVMS